MIYHLNAEFQRIARRDKKAFLSDQCKEIEENNRMGKTRDMFNQVAPASGLEADDDVSDLQVPLLLQVG